MEKSGSDKSQQKRKNTNPFVQRECSFPLRAGLSDSEWPLGAFIIISARVMGKCGRGKE